MMNKKGKDILINIVAGILGGSIFFTGMLYLLGFLPIWVMLIPAGIIFGILVAWIVDELRHPTQSYKAEIDKH